MRSEFVFLPLYILFGAVRANGERTIQECKVREVNYDASGNLIYDETITDNCAGTCRTGVCSLHLPSKRMRCL
ncbi:hypothetical protein ACCO45_011845 [Purpureocillium lilacinum]|uniref:Uncharacterized protein n=1 Tax=Purpureocillium lilacinum TaxID=33203 RepID=A0ACC4DDJ3_PURLI